MCLENTVNLLNRFLLNVNKQRFSIEILELLFVNGSNVSKALHLIRLKKLKFLSISFNKKCFFSA